MLLKIASKKGVQGEPGVPDIPDKQQREQPRNSQWQEEGQQVGKHHHLLENEGIFLKFLAFDHQSLEFNIALPQVTESCPEC